MFDFTGDKEQALKALKEFCDQSNRYELAPCKFPNVPYPVYARCGTTDWASIYQIFVEEELKNVCSEELDVVVDLGAYAGYASIYIASRSNSRLIVSVEPDPDNYSLLLLNTRPYPCIEALHAGVWSDSKGLTLGEKIGGDWGTTVHASSDARSRRNRIKSLTLRDIVSKYSLKSIDLLKVDIEGSEVELFRGDAIAVRDLIRLAAVETHDRFKSGSTESVVAFFPESLYCVSASGEKLVFTRKSELTPEQATDPEPKESMHDLTKPDAGLASGDKIHLKQSNQATATSISSFSKAGNGLITPRKKYYLGVLAMFKNESHVLREWILHYLREGVEHFFFVDNNSTDNYGAALEGIPAECYSIKVDERKHAQAKIYEEMLPVLRRQCKWIAVLDLDEFLYSRMPRSSITNYLASLPGDVSAICVPWKIFGSNSHDEQPSSVIHGFTRRGMYSQDRKNPGMNDAQSSLGKYIVRSNRVTYLGVHAPTITKGKIISSDGAVLAGGPYIPISEGILGQSCLHLNHYAIQSRQWFEQVKMTRGDVAWQQHDETRNASYFRAFDINDCGDNELSRKHSLLAV